MKEDVAQVFWLRRSWKKSLEADDKEKGNIF